MWRLRRESIHPLKPFPHARAQGPMFTIVFYGAKFFDRNTAQIQRNAPRISLLRATCEEQTAQRRENVRAYDVSGLSMQLSHRSAEQRLG